MYRPNVVSLTPKSERWGARVLCGLNTASARHDERTASKEVVDRPFDRGEKLICIYTCCQKTYFSRVSGVNIWNSKIAFIWEIGFQQKYIAHWLYGQCSSNIPIHPSIHPSCKHLLNNYCIKKTARTIILEGVLVESHLKVYKRIVKLWVRHIWIHSAVSSLWDFTQVT